MIPVKETQYTVDAASKTIHVKREFDASVEQVWKAWTQPEYLDQWWAPKPWKAVTVSMDFRPGGAWRYYMQGPEGEKHHCRADYQAIVANKQFTGTDAFTDENGNSIKDMPVMQWDVRFSPDADGTRVNVTLTFNSEEDLNKIVEMGFKEGFAAAHQNLDELLANQNKR